MDEGLCCELTMLGLIVETFVSGKGIVPVIGLRVWLSCNWLFSILTQQTSAQKISETCPVFSLLQ